MESIILTKYICITGGVVSSIGKGITSASIGRLLRSYGLKVAAIKIDPYLNWDSGTLNPYQHGEVFVTYDGMETDLDLGHYERFLDVELPGVSNITTGKVYSAVIEKERKGEFLGACVQIIPHITDQIKAMIREVSEEGDYDVVMVELGGTVGDIESQPFIEALRQLRNEEGFENVMFAHVTFVPYLDAAKEFKTKPTQHSTKELRSMGINPDMIVTRSPKPIGDELRMKIASFCDVSFDAVVHTPDASSIYEVPLVLNQFDVGNFINNRLSLGVDTNPNQLDDWADVVDRLKIQSPEVTIGIVGKYVEYEDAYISIRESLHHAAAAIGVKMNIEYFTSDVDSLDLGMLEHLDGILIPGGFGERGLKGKLDAINYALDNKVPIFGICLGMQLAVIEYARHVAGLPEATSTEFNRSTKYPLIGLITEWLDERGELQHRSLESDLGGTMRLGAQKSELVDGAKIRTIYGQSEIIERHRHRYEMNDRFIETIEQAGMKISGYSSVQHLVETVEIPEHPWFIAVQFHPEFTSSPRDGHPLFASFIDAAKKQHQKSK